MEGNRGGALIVSSGFAFVGDHSCVLGIALELLELYCICCPVMTRLELLGPFLLCRLQSTRVVTLQETISGQRTVVTIRGDAGSLAMYIYLHVRMLRHQLCLTLLTFGI